MNVIEAIAYMTPDPASNGTISLRSAKAREAMGVIAGALEDLRLGVAASLSLLASNEPGDSRAVSDEFVSLASLDAGIMNDEARDILRQAILSKADPIDRPLSPCELKLEARI